MRATQITTLVVSTVIFGCVRKVADYPVPANALTLSSGVRCVTIKPSKGQPATAGELYGVNWTLLSHTKRGCTYPCEERELLPRAELKDARWREVILSMHEGEVRRVWIVEKPKQEARVYDVVLASVDRLGPDGQAIVDTSSP
jgi:hypothetical protein